MVNVITSFSRITILSFVLIFTLIDLVQIFEYKLNEAVYSILSTIQSVMVVLFLFNGTFVLFMAKEDAGMIMLGIFTCIFFVGFYVAVYRLSDFVPRALINNMFLFISFGIIALARLKTEFAAKHMIFLFITLVISLFVIMGLKYVDRIERFMYIFAIVGIILLLIVAFFGQVENGAKLSFAAGPIRLQPSEFIKLSFLFFISGCIVTFKDMRGFLIASVGSAVHVVALVLARDLGTALIFLTAYVFVMFIAYKNYIVLSLEIGVATIGGILAYHYFPHIQTRFIAWTDPLSVVDDKGYQISQSLFAIGTGGWLGSGLNKGMPNKIPVVTMDFIFAAISEEMGAIVGVCLIVCFACTVMLILNAAFNCNNSFYMLVSSGIAVLFAVQTILNIGGVIKFIPSTGVTLPFISYGGNSLLSLMLCFLIVSCSNNLYFDSRQGRRHDR